MPDGFNFTVSADDRSKAGFDSALSRAKAFAGRLKGVITAPFRALTSMNTMALVSNLRTLKNLAEGFVELNAVQERAEAKLGAILKSTNYAAGQTIGNLKKIASELQGKTIFGDESIIGGQALLASFKNVRGDIFNEATSVMLDLSAAMEQDLKSSAVQLGKALNDPLVGLTALSRVGVTFSERQKETIKGFVETNQLAKAQAVILDELKSEFGGVAQAMAKTSSGAIQQMKNALADLGESLGAALGPVLTRGAKQLQAWAESATAFMQRNMAAISRIIDISLTGAARAAIDGFKAAFGTVLELPGIADITRSAGTLVSTLAKLPLRLTQAFVSIEKGILNLVATLLDAVAKMIDAFTPLVHTLTWKLSGKDEAWNAAMAMTDAWSQLRTAADKARTGAEDLDATLSDVDKRLRKIDEEGRNFSRSAKLDEQKKAWQEVGDRIKVAFGPLSGARDRLMDPIIRGLRGLKTEAKLAGEALADALAKKAGEAADKLKAALDRLRDAQGGLRGLGFERMEQQYELNIAGAKNQLERDRATYRYSRQFMAKANIAQSPEEQSELYKRAEDLLHGLLVQLTEQGIGGKYKKEVEQRLLMVQRERTGIAEAGVAGAQAGVDEAARAKQLADTQQQAQIAREEAKRKLAPFGEAALEGARYIRDLGRAAIDAKAALNSLRAQPSSGGGPRSGWGVLTDPAEANGLLMPAAG